MSTSTSAKPAAVNNTVVLSPSSPVLKPEGKIIHLIRHGQAHHNVGHRLHLRDPALTDLGEQQCRDLRVAFPYAKSCTLVVTSPLRRTVQTALIGLEDAIHEGTLPVVAEPLFQENGQWQCDIGTEVEELKKLFDTGVVDFEACNSEPWPHKKGLYTPAKVPQRALKAREWLLERPEKEIAVVCHGGFIHYLTEDWTGFNKSLGTAWQNTEFRSYHLTKNSTLVETQESKDRRGFKDPALPEGDDSEADEAEKTEQREVKSVEGKGSSV